MKHNVLIIGAGGVAHVAAHKAAAHNDVLGDICIASRTLSKCHQIIESVNRKGHLLDTSKKLYARQLDALDIDATVAEELERYPAELHPQLKEIYSKEDARLSLALRLLHQRALDKLVSIAKGEGVLLPGDAAPAAPSEVLIAH